MVEFGFNFDEVFSVVILVIDVLVYLELYIE